MAREELPVLLNFFQIDTSASNKNGQHSPHYPVKGLSSTEKAEQKLDRSVRNESRVATNCYSGDSSPMSMGMDADALDGKGPHKRVERSGEDRRVHEEATMDDLRLTMQPPRIVSSNSQPPAATHLDATRVVSKYRHCNNMPFFSEMFGPSGTSRKRFYPDGLPTNDLRESNSATLLNVSPADEGSRTGLKGSNGSELLNQTMAEGPVLSLGQSKASSRGVGSESTFLVGQETMPVRRQLTIFYGGQAHVFEDVSLEKAEAIMALAGSTGRSWSTVYSQQRKASLPLSVTDGSLSTYDKDGTKAGIKPNPANFVENSSGFSSEVQNASSSFLDRGHGRLGESRVPEYTSQFSKMVMDMQTIADYVEKKPEGTLQISARAVDMDKDVSAFHR